VFPKFVLRFFENRAPNFTITDTACHDSRYYLSIKSHPPLSAGDIRTLRSTIRTVSLHPSRAAATCHPGWHGRHQTLLLLLLWCASNHPAQRKRRRWKRRRRQKRNSEDSQEKNTCHR